MQCFVTFGASVNMGGATMVLAYSTGLVLQLRRPGSEIPVSIAEESWIAAMPAVFSLLGSCLTAMGMSLIGRRYTQIASIIVVIVGWLFIVFAKDITVILVGRFFHGIAMGASMLLTPIINAEYSSPKYRGTFMPVASSLASLNVLISHSTALYLSWRTNAIICTAIAVANLLIAVCSPESPSWLAARRRYDDCRHAFRWLRGDDEEEELTNMINACEILHKSKIENGKASNMTIGKKIAEFKTIMMKKEFYKPVLIMFHVYTAGLWAASWILSTFVFDLIPSVVGEGYNHHALGLNIHRFVGGVVAIYFITKIRRRVLFLVVSALTVIILLATAAFTYAKSIGVLTSDLPALGLFLLHLHTVVLAICMMPLPFIIGGEIFPLRYKSFGSGVSSTFFFVGTAILLKSFPFLLNSVGVHGTYTIYSCIILYCLVILYFYLPETKDKTLQEIEEEMIGKPCSSDEMKSVQQTLLNEPVINE
ncbi:facilitated trehalose transporter Tret1-like [Ostrinia nubilalis]|uniref:facilitated trehalose transporter Tret1-like n=1 Tax=Ostrinia nubilalis TaxID=29057 RepID=UPI0030823EBC